MAQEPQLENIGNDEAEHPDSKPADLVKHITFQPLKKITVVVVDEHNRVSYSCY